MKFLKTALVSLSLLLISSSKFAAAKAEDAWDDVFSNESEEDEPVVVPPQVPESPRVLGASFGVPPGSAPKLEQQQSNGPPLQQQQGSNYGTINQTCGSGSGRICSLVKNLECIDGRCSCKPNLSNLDAGYVYSPVGDKCYQVATTASHFSCDVHEQCTKSKLGRYSRCNQAFTCECYDTEGRYRTTMKHEDVCYVKKELQDQCETDMECQVTILGEAVCLGLRSEKNLGICQCAGGYDYDILLKECLKRGSLNSTCKADSQCNDPLALGELAFCNPKTAQCECKDVKDGAKWETGHLNGKCYYKRGANETCWSREECVLGYGNNAECLKHPAYNDETVCQCPVDKECSGNTFQLSVGLIIVGVIVAHVKSKL